jgi:protein-cysteine N-palmitoyltransferase HHAT
LAGKWCDLLSLPSFLARRSSLIPLNSQDTSDHQWNTFRSNLPMLIGLLGLYMLSSTLFNRFYRPSPSASSISLPPKAIFVLSFALPLLFLLHGSSLPKILAILSLNFWVSRTARWGGKWSRAAPAVGWAFNLAVLFSNELCEGYRWESLSSGLAWLVSRVYAFLERKRS